MLSAAQPPIMTFSWVRSPACRVLRGKAERGLTGGFMSGSTRIYQRLVQLALLLVGVSLLALFGKSFQQGQREYRPALWSCSVVGSALP